MKNKVKNTLLYFAVAFTVLSLSYCATVSMPTGGPQDTTPPKVMFSIPENNSTNFKSKKIEINFDEYVTLDNASQNILVSPPLKNKPDAKLVGKSLIIKFKDELKPDATYNVSFGSSIRDLHEGNVLDNFEFTFSTGDHIDTCSIAGVVLDAREKKPVDNVFVTLYDASSDNLDSLPMIAPPSHIARTNKDGRFRFKGLADADYLVFALKDMNGNYYFDQPNEDVAFMDTLVRAVYDGRTSIDTLVADTTAIDSIAPAVVSDMKVLDLTLYMFSKTDTTQLMLEKKLVERGLFRFVFRQPDSTLKITPLTSLPDSLEHVAFLSKTFDTLFWYFTPDKADSASFVINGSKGLADTVKISLKAKSKNNSSVKFGITNNLKGDLLMPEERLVLNFTEPIREILPNDSLLVLIDSTSSIPAIFTPADSSRLEYVLNYDPVEGKDLSLYIPDSVFIGMRGTFNNVDKVAFHRAKEDEYGNLFIKVKLPEGIPQIIVELLSESNNVIDKQIVTEDKELEYWYLSSGKYKLRATLDADANGRWSSGDYSRRFQPEKVVEYKTVLDVRAGWDIDLDEPWDLRQ